MNSPTRSDQSSEVPPSAGSGGGGAAPTAARRPLETEHHGDQRIDDYEWLRAKDDPAVIGYLEAENAYTEARTAHLAALRETIFSEIKSRTQETDLSVPTRNRRHWYYSRSFAGKEYGATCRVPISGDDDWTPPQPAVDCLPDEPALPGEQVLLDLNLLAAGHEFFSMGGSSVSPDEMRLAYAVDVVGDERYCIQVKDLTTGALLDDQISGARGGVTWARDGQSFYYVTVDDAWRSDKVWQHTLGNPQAEDVLVFHETDERFWVGIDRSRDDRFLMISAGSRTTSEYRIFDADDPEAGFWLFAERVDELEYALEPAVIAGRPVFLVLHNLAGADFELSRAPIAPAPPAQWVTLIAHDAAVRLESVDAFATHLVVNQRSGGLTQLRIVELTDAGLGDDYLVGLDNEIYAVGSSGNPSFDQPVVRLGYTSLTTPASIYDYRVSTRELTLLRRTPVLGGFRVEDYVERRLWASAHDGEQIPISIVCRRDLVQTGPLPVLLYGYGSYEASMDPYFSVARLSLLDRGAAFAIAHVRGGGEMGRRWYDNGKLAHKQNTFSDFVACAQHLVEQRWTSPDRLIAEGASAGGLLVGAVANQAPELFAGIVAAVPFVDALTTMLDSSLPLTVIEYDEWGDPAADSAAYGWLRAYAPYDNVTAQQYPAILAETSLNDTRVLYVEPAKWIAKLRATATGTQDFLLKTEMAAGHGGVSGRYQAWRDRAFSLAWMLDRMGLPPESRP
ncbi:MAG: S9 family peptidase [Nocardioides sp.]